MKLATLISLLLFLSGAALFLIQLWFQPWGGELFSKLLLTNGILFGISLVAAFLIKENKASQKLNDDGGLD